MYWINLIALLLIGLSLFLHRFMYRSEDEKNSIFYKRSVENRSVYDIAYYGMCMLCDSKNHYYSTVTSKQIVEDLFSNVATKKDRIFCRLASRLISSYERTNGDNINWYLKACALLAYLFEEPLNCVLAVFIFVAIELYFYNLDYVDWLPGNEEVFFYSVPICSFIVLWLLLHKCCKKASDAWKISMILSICISTITSIYCYSWAEAVEQRTHVLIREIGPDYNDVLQEIENDMNYTNERY